MTQEEATPGKKVIMVDLRHGDTKRGTIVGPETLGGIDIKTGTVIVQTLKGLFRVGVGMLKEDTDE